MRAACAPSLVTSSTCAPTAGPEAAAQAGDSEARSAVKPSWSDLKTRRTPVTSRAAVCGLSSSRSSSVARAPTVGSPTMTARPERRCTICFRASTGPSGPFVSTSPISSSIDAHRLRKPAMNRLRASRRVASGSSSATGGAGFESGSAAGVRTTGGKLVPTRTGGGAIPAGGAGSRANSSAAEGDGLAGRSGIAPRTTTLADGTAKIRPFVKSGPTGARWVSGGQTIGTADPPAAAITVAACTIASFGRDSAITGTACDRTTDCAATTGVICIASRRTMALASG